MRTRRTLLQQGTKLGALCLAPLLDRTAALGQGTTKPRLPLEEFVKEAKLVTSLRRGVAAMKARRPSDPTSWFFQGAVHAVLNNEVVRVAQSDPEMANLDVDRFWNKCPHFGENAGNFLLWHRAYLYYFERILRDASQDADVSLPYWNYTDGTGAGTATSKRLIPPIFLGALVGGAGSEANSLFHRSRDPDASRGLSELSLRAVDPALALGSPVFFGATEPEGFAGGVVDGEADGNTSGIVERRPHNLVHLFVGDLSATAGQQGMASVAEAAFDPLFWVHHANIDRLWVEFVGSADKTWGTLPSATWFDDKPWAFFDFDKQVKTETRAFWMDHRKLGYSYFNEQSPKLAWPPALAVAAART